MKRGAETCETPIASRAAGTAAVRPGALDHGRLGGLEVTGEARHCQRERARVSAPAARRCILGGRPRVDGERRRRTCENGIGCKRVYGNEASLVKRHGSGICSSQRIGIGHARLTTHVACPDHPLAAFICCSRLAIAVVASAGLPAACAATRPHPSVPFNDATHSVRTSDGLMPAQINRKGLRGRGMQRRGSRDYGWK
jgi:hypothetical protein